MTPPEPLIEEVMDFVSVLMSLVSVLMSLISVLAAPKSNVILPKLAETCSVLFTTLSSPLKADAKLL